MKKCCDSPQLRILLNSRKHNKNQQTGELSTMRNGKTVLAQMQEIISRYNFEKVVFMHNGDCQFSRN